MYKSSRCHRAPLAALLLFGCVHSRQPERGRRRPAGTGSTPPPSPARPAPTPARFALEKIATWRDDAAAAYAIVHDDLCSPELRGIDRIAAPALEARGLTATMGAIVRHCQEYRAVGHGARPREPRPRDRKPLLQPRRGAAAERRPSRWSRPRRVLDAHVAHPVSFFLFPYDAFRRQTVELVESAGHSVVRAGPRDDNDGLTNPPINGSDPDNDAALEFDAWPRAVLEVRPLSREGHPQRPRLERHRATGVRRARASQRHPRGSRPRPPGRASSRCRCRSTKRTWTSWSTPGRPTSSGPARSRPSCATATPARPAGASLAGAHLRFDASDPDCRRHATPLSVVVRTEKDVPGLAAIQAGKPVFTASSGRRASASPPTLPAPTSSSSGCATAVARCRPRRQLAQKATAGRVGLCAGERARRRSGRPDGRPRAGARTAPAPAQPRAARRSQRHLVLVSTEQPGREHPRTRARTGTSATPARGLNASAGVVLAFLGGSGAGSCYDASAYRGFRFKIRGTTTSNDPAARDKVVISLVTAETQSLRYGGDLRGSGGHFHLEVPISPAVATGRADLGPVPATHLGRHRRAHAAGAAASCRPSTGGSRRRSRASG